MEHGLPEFDCGLLEKAQRILIVGPRRSGKTTLLKEITPFLLPGAPVLAWCDSVLGQEELNKMFRRRRRFKLEEDAGPVLLVEEETLESKIDRVVAKGLSVAVSSHENLPPIVNEADLVFLTCPLQEDCREFVEQFVPRAVAARHVAEKHVLVITTQEKKVAFYVTEHQKEHQKDDEQEDYDLFVFGMTKEAQIEKSKVYYENWRENEKAKNPKWKAYNIPAVSRGTVLGIPDDVLAERDRAYRALERARWWKQIDPRTSYNDELLRLKAQKNQGNMFFLM